MRRREVIAGLALPFIVSASQAQQARVYRIAVLHPSARAGDVRETGGDAPFVAGFFEELRRLGYVEGQNLAVVLHSGEGRIERDAQLARDAVAANPDLIFAVSTRMLLALKAATSTVPIVGIGGDPVAQGLVSNLARPGGNITGASVDPGLDLYGKRLQILKEAVPGASRVALLVPQAAWDGSVLPAYIEAMRQAAQQAGMTLVGAPVGSPADETEYRRALASLAADRVDALIADAFAENFAQRRLIVDLAAAARLPAIYPDRSVVEIGGLIAYAVDRNDIYRRAAVQVDQILKGAKPGDIPFHQPTKFELVINLRTAKALGVAFAPSLLARADEVIE
jgi:putative ABC transport system substrate-binding protein